MKKILLILLFVLIIPISVYAKSGCCSSHGGVDCSRKQSNGKVVCNDGWTGSSCYYSEMEKCNGYDEYEDETYYSSGRDDDSWEYIFMFIICGVVYFGISFLLELPSMIKEEKRMKKKEKQEKIEREIRLIKEDKRYNSYTIDELITIFEGVIEKNLVITIKYQNHYGEIVEDKINPERIFIKNLVHYLEAYSYEDDERIIINMSNIIGVKRKK